MATSSRIRTEVPGDEVLVERSRVGDHAAFRELYERYSDYVARVIWRILGRDDVLEDLVQETFVEAFDGLDRLRDGQRFRAWLTTIAVRRTKRELARRHRRRLIARALRGQADLEAGTKHMAGMAQALYEALERLAPAIRIPWALHRIEGQTLEETAESCGVSLATVKRRIQRADERLRRLLGHA